MVEVTDEQAAEIPAWAKERALAEVNDAYESIAGVAGVSLDALNRPRPQEMKYGSMDEVIREWSTMAGAIAGFAVGLKLITSKEALEAILQFQEPPPGDLGRSGSGATPRSRMSPHNPFMLSRPISPAVAVHAVDRAAVGSILRSTLSRGTPMDWRTIPCVVLVCVLLVPAAVGAQQFCSRGVNGAFVEMRGHADTASVPESERPFVLADTNRVIAERLRGCGVLDPVVHLEADDSFRVAVPAAWNPDQTAALLGRQAIVDFREERVVEGISEWIVATGAAPGGRATALTGQRIAHVELTFERATNRPLILFELDEEGTALFKEITARLVRRRLGIFVDGEPLMTPVVQEAITSGRGQITGAFTADEARTLTVQVAAGPLPVPVWIESDSTED